jgi:exosortase
MNAHRKLVGALLLLSASFVFLFRNVGIQLIRNWYIDENYSHGFLIIPLAAYLVWERRARLRDLPDTPATLAGAVVLLGSLVVLLTGLLGAELFLSRIAIVGTLVGSILFVLGWRHLSVLFFPVAILLLMIPIPAIIFNQIVFPLQLLASRVGQFALSTAGIPVLREGNIIILANTTLEVAEACSGIRSLVSLLTLGIICGYFTDSRASIRVLVALAAIPVAIFANGLRVAGTGIAAHYYGRAAAEGFFHTFSGWFVFVAAFLMLFGVIRMLLWVSPAPPILPSQSTLAA